MSPPVLSRLVRTEFQPAYLHHAPPDQGTLADLKGLRQRMPDAEVSLTGGQSVFSVPHGTEVVLTATSDKPLAAAFLQPKVGKLPGAKPGSSDLVPLTVDATGLTFSTELGGSWFADIAQALRGRLQVIDNVEFDLVIVDTDGIRVSRPVLIQKVDDHPPTVELAVDVLRKQASRQGQVYLATPAARVPFVPESVVRDDRGLSRVEYTFEYCAGGGPGGRRVAGAARRPALRLGPRPGGPGVGRHAGVQRHAGAAPEQGGRQRAPARPSSAGSRSSAASSAATRWRSSRPTSTGRSPATGRSRSRR